ncbi:hypothetical protein RYA05_10490 [Pseudomonas syringae pv. actinidiae]|uniref:Uncharacterized protein n=1 Tax=Pseudomonas syringae pv. actinidiae TaxID=103796 RepID=M1J6F0_PSESF|nr:MULTISPECIES: hypothetical protein [Pseudomonas syringae group]EPN60051.1 hypothetical protein A235_25411 [Pseudomonas syringae pv. actinidiae ICMP 19079]KTC11638.1 hypothetical protein AO390_09670 [Pseudomonas marginalis ICMP 11289]MEE5081238.1 hypothetical protein [Pseudomonas alliivorans]AGE82414.1 hypothetical protein [Pseudomonas syringae pv. actinidiae]AGE82538.1 hypothetical protein [Pseudomonas syringae pv. actinidiae]
MSTHNTPFLITHQCCNCGHHLPRTAVLATPGHQPECPRCHSGEIIELEPLDAEWRVTSINKAPRSNEYTVVFRIKPAGSQKAFMKMLTDTFVDHEVEIVEMQSGNKLTASGGK